VESCYEVLAGRGEPFSGGTEQSVTYGDPFARSYPFHPQLVRVLDKRIGSIGNIDRARGALNLLAGAGRVASTSGPLPPGR
jgi:hypothetical protein